MVKLKWRKPRLALLLLLLGMAVTVSAQAGSTAIGSVAVGRNASVSGQGLLPNTTIFSGDSLRVSDGVAVIALGSNNRLIFGRDTSASFLLDSRGVTVLLSQGNVSMLHPTDGTPLRVKAGEISINPAPGLKTFADIAVLEGSVVITAKEGALQVEDHGTTRNVAKGQTIVIALEAAKGNGGAVATSAVGGGIATGSVGGVSAAVGAITAATAGVAADKFARPGATRPDSAGNGSYPGGNGPTLTGAASAAAAAAGTDAGCAPPTPSRPPTASTVIPFGATPGPVCPFWYPQ